MKTTKLNAVGVLTLSILLSACETGGPNSLAGVFGESPVQGLGWVSDGWAAEAIGEDALEGTTDSEGVFRYRIGDTIEFSVGDIALGHAQAKSVLTPIDLVEGAETFHDPAVINIYRFLLTLDNDGDSTNGIQIHPETSNAGMNASVDFNQPTTAFGEDSDLQDLIAILTATTEAGERPLTSVSEALLYAGEDVEKLVAGHYTGTFTGHTLGTWEGTILESGEMTGTVTTYHKHYEFQGSVSMDGSGTTDFETNGAVADDGTTFSGTFETNGTGGGSWVYFDSINGIEYSGTWSGSKDN